MEHFALKFKPLLTNQKLIFVVTLLLTLLTAWFLGKLLMRSLHQVEQPIIKQLNKAAQGNQDARGQVSYFFGKPEPKAVETPQVNVEAIKETRLNLSLIGVLDMGDQGVAIFKRSGNTFMVSEGEDIQPQVQLIDVMPNQVIIENRGVQERLELVAITNPLLVEQQDYLPSASGSSAQATSSEVKRQLKKIKKAPLTISKFIRFKPMGDQGNWHAIRIWSNGDKKLFKEVGFQEGDELISVNDKSVEELSRNPNLLQSILKQNQFSVVVVRQGAQQTITLNLNE